MRDIKFRAFNGDRIVKVNTIGWIDGEIDWIDTSKNDDFDENLILMQYTGKKDINGIEIYEGDILACYGSFTDLGYTLQANVEVEDIYEMAFIIRNCDKYEVIGNIYENPELLED